MTLTPGGDWSAGAGLDSACTGPVEAEFSSIIDSEACASGHCFPCPPPGPGTEGPSPEAQTAGHSGESVQT